LNEFYDPGLAFRREDDDDGYDEGENSLRRNEGEGTIRHALQQIALIRGEQPAWAGGGGETRAVSLG